MPAHRKAWVCSIDGCERPHVARGWCHTHYTRWRKHGNPVADVKVQAYSTDQACSVDGCDEQPKANGWCIKHYTRWRRYGDPMVVARVSTYGGLGCSVPGCTRQAASRGWCNTHWSRWRRRGDPLWPVENRPRCFVCNHPQVAAIDEAIANGKTRAAISREFDVPYHCVRYHGSIRHAEAVARNAANRLESVRKWAATA